MKSSRTVFAIDPGSSKCGVALAHRDGQGEVVLDWRSVTPRAELLDSLQKASQIRPFNQVIVGSGTRSREIVDELREALPAIGILLVDERDTTLQARERYWEHNPRRGLRRLVPATLQLPPVPVDDFVALILAERVLLAD